MSKAGTESAALLVTIRQMVEDCPPEVHARQNLALLYRPDAEPQIVSGGGHLLTFEKPVEVAQISDGWLSRRQLA